MRMLLLLPLFFLGNTTLMADEFEERDKDPISPYRLCMGSPSPDIPDRKVYCEVVASEIQDGNHAETATKGRRNINAMKRGCDLGSLQLCNNILMDTQIYASKYIDEVMSYVRLNCESGNRNTCDSLSQFYEEQKNYPLALKYAKLHYERHREGNYIWLDYNHGERPRALKAALQNCRAENDKCPFYLRYMPDHPQQSELLKYTEQDCNQLNPAGSRLGATSCAIAGTFHYKKGAYDKAHAVWSQDCLQNKNDTSCNLMIGSSHSSEEQKIQAGFELCSTKNSAYTLSAPHVDLKKDVCPQIKSERRLPAAITARDRQILQNFLKEQK